MFPATGSNKLVVQCEPGLTRTSTFKNIDVLRQEKQLFEYDFRSLGRQEFAGRLRKQIVESPRVMSRTSGRE